MSSDAEISMEMDPGTFDGEKMKRMMELGVNSVIGSSGVSTGAVEVLWESSWF